MNCCLIRARNELALRAGRIPPNAMSVLHHLDSRAVRPTQAIMSGNRGATGVEMNVVDRLRLRGDERPVQFLIE